MTNKKTNEQGHKVSGRDIERDDIDERDYDGRDTYMQGCGERDKNNSSEDHTCQVCGCEQGQPLEDFEDSEDFVLTDDCGRTVDADGPIVICEECFEDSHDTHWYATHPEY